jgi:ATP:ADP antiporter, AAA family
VAGNEIRPFFEELARAYLKYAVELLHMQKALPTDDFPSQLIYNAVDLELQEIRELLLGLFSFLYDREQIRKVRRGLDANQKESIANAMEIIELTVRKDIGRYFNILYENIPIDRKCDDLKFLNTDIHYQQTSQVLGRILSEQPIYYQDWTKACSMYISKKYGLSVDIRLFDKYLEADNQILQETARYACA